jgi:glycosyltransferase involved in cell wall biosynthesis
VTEAAGPRLTVHVPCHDYGRFLGQALDSLLAQTSTDWEAIVIDDASTDDTAQVVARYDDPRLRFVRHDVNRGHIATFNEAIGLARGEYFVILSADDRYHATFFERALACFDASPDVTLVYTDAEIIDQDGRVLGISATTLDPDHDWVRDVSVQLMLCPFIRGCAAVAPTPLLRELNGYDPALFHTCDTYLWRQLAFRGRVGHLSGRCYQQREHRDAMHTTTSWLKLMTTEEPQQFARLFDDPALPADVAALRPRLEATLDVYRARREYHDHRYGAAASAFLAAAGRDPKLWEADHPWWAFARDYARNHRRTG